MSASKDENNQILKHFLNSLKINPTKPEQMTEVLKWDLPADDDKVYTPKEVTQKATVVWNPGHFYTEEARKNQIQGVVRISAILGADGIVRNVKAIKELPDGLTETAIRSAKRIRFFPAQKDGKRVSQYVTLEYNFRIY